MQMRLNAEQFLIVWDNLAFNATAITQWFRSHHGIASFFSPPDCLFLIPIDKLVFLFRWNIHSVLLGHIYFFSVVLRSVKLFGKLQVHCMGILGDNTIYGVKENRKPT